jgi:hypothetical protein
MAILGEITELLRRWDVWKRVEAAPDRIDALEKRVVELEARLQHAPGEACPSCGALSFRTIKSEPMAGPLSLMGAKQITLQCQDCGFEDVRSG